MVNAPDCGSGISWVRSPSAAPFENNSGLPEFLFYLNKGTVFSYSSFYIYDKLNVWAVLSFDFSENVVTVYSFEQMINKKKSRLFYEKEENSIQWY